MTTIYPPTYASGRKYYGYCKALHTRFLYRVDIHQKGYSGDAYEIDNISAMRLSLQEGGAIEDGIVKSTFTLSMIDTPDKVAAAGHKNCDWDEFFTPDATMYRVHLYESANDGETWRAKWTGYITPDSWQEDLDSFGTVTITARDNLGHLSDFEFDMAGENVTLRSIIQAAVSKIYLPMNVVLNTDKLGYWIDAITYDGEDILDTYLYIPPLREEGKSWYEVLEGIMTSFGMQIRWVDNNKVGVMYLSSLFCYANPDASNFLNGSSDITVLSGTKTMDPAYRTIEEKMTYEGEDDIDLSLDASFGEQTTANVIEPCEYPYDSVPAIVHPADNPDNNQGWADLSALFNPANYELDAELLRNEGEGAKDYTFLLCGAGNGSTAQEYIIKGLRSVDIQLNIEMTQPLVMAASRTVDENNVAHWTPIALAYHYFKQPAVKVYVRSESTAASVPLYWSGSEWTTSKVYMEFGSEGTQETNIDNISIRLAEIEGYFYGHLYIGFDFFYTGACPTYNTMGTYARMKSLSLSFNKGRYESDTVTTINNELYNVRASRTPMFGVLSSPGGPFTPYVVQEQYSNILWERFSTSYWGPLNYYLKYWGESLPLPVIVHKMLLTFHHKAMPVLTGDFLIESNGKFDYYLSYKGQKYMIQSATLNCRTGVFENATLRGFEYYSAIFE